jgi:hypothetical protein
MYVIASTRLNNESRLKTRQEQTTVSEEVGASDGALSAN